MVAKKGKLPRPIYSEQAIFSVCITFLLLLVVNSEMRKALLAQINGDSGFYWLVLFLVGLGVSLHACFKDGEKSKQARELIWIFLFIINIFLISQTSTFLETTSALGYINLSLSAANTFFLIYQWFWWGPGKGKAVKGAHLISQEDAHVSDIVIITVIMTGLVLTLNYGFKIHWVTTFVLLNSYGLFLSGFVARTLKPKV